jgi:threonine/homoserine/homoserine lactone efflux protein
VAVVPDLGLHDAGLFALTVFVVNATPGVDLLYTLVCTLRHGRSAGLAAALGIASGCVIHALGAAFGLAALMAASAAVFQLVKWAGAAYLLWLALGMLRSATRRSAAAAIALAGEPEGAVAAPAPKLMPIFRRGLLTNVLNPKVALFFLALLPQFIAADAPNKTLAFLALGAWFVAQGLLFLIAFVVLVAPLAKRRTPAALRRGLEAAGAGLFTLLALRLAMSQR